MFLFVQRFSLIVCRHCVCLPDSLGLTLFHCLSPLHWYPPVHGFVPFYTVIALVSLYAYGTVLFFIVFLHCICNTLTHGTVHSYCFWSLHWCHPLRMALSPFHCLPSLHRYHFSRSLPLSLRRRDAPALRSAHCPFGSCFPRYHLSVLLMGDAWIVLEEMGVGVAVGVPRDLPRSFS